MPGVIQSNAELCSNSWIQLRSFIHYLILFSLGTSEHIATRQSYVFSHRRGQTGDYQEVVTANNRHVGTLFLRWCLISSCSSSSLHSVNFRLGLSSSGMGVKVEVKYGKKCQVKPRWNTNLQHNHSFFLSFSETKTNLFTCWMLK